MMCVGDFYDNSAREAIQFFDTIAENAQTWETNTSVDTAKVHNTPTGGGLHHLRENDDLQEKIANLTRKLEAIELKKVNEVTSVPQVPSLPTGPRVEEPCIICDDPTHSAINCPNLPQVKGAIQIEQGNALNYQRNLSILHIPKHIIQDGVSTLILVGEMKEAHKTCQTIKAPIIKTKVFQIQLLHFRIKVLKDFL